MWYDLHNLWRTQKTPSIKRRNKGSFLSISTNVSHFPAATQPKSSDRAILVATTDRQALATTCACARGNYLEIYNNNYSPPRISQLYAQCKVLSQFLRKHIHVQYMYKYYEFMYMYVPSYIHTRNCVHTLYMKVLSLTRMGTHTLITPSTS